MNEAHKGRDTDKPLLHTQNRKPGTNITVTRDSIGGYPVSRDWSCPIADEGLNSARSYWPAGNSDYVILKCQEKSWW